MRVAFDGIAFEGIAFDGRALKMSLRAAAAITFVFEGIAFEGIAFEGIAFEGIAFEGIANVRPCNFTNALMRPPTLAQLNRALPLIPPPTSMNIEPPAGRPSSATTLAGRAYDGIALDGIPLDGMAFEGMALDGMADAGSASDGIADAGSALEGKAYTRPLTLTRPRTFPAVLPHVTATGYASPLSNSTTMQSDSGSTMPTSTPIATAVTTTDVTTTAATEENGEYSSWNKPTVHSRDRENIARRPPATIV